MSSPAVILNTSQLPASATQEASPAGSNDNEKAGVTVKPMRCMFIVFSAIKRRIRANSYHSL